MFNGCAKGFAFKSAAEAKPQDSHVILRLQSSNGNLLCFFVFVFLTLFSPSDTQLWKIAQQHFIAQEIVIVYTTPFLMHLQGIISKLR